MTEWEGLPFDEPEESGGPAGPIRPLSVSALTARLKSIVERSMGLVAVEGEVSNCRAWSSGHIYFTLKDDGAQLRAVLFRMRARLLATPLEDGMRVIARGRLNLYEVKGEYQLVCDTVEPHGLGALQAAFERLKRRLQAEGLFAVDRKRALPVLPRRIGIVTSLDGAALRDILRVLGQRHPSARIVVRPARVQGEGAATDLIRALRAIARVPDVDVIIIGRGGGSAEDLWAFNDEGLARAIVQCPVPVISAVGHEVDVTIADFVADVRAATPSNAAELVVDRADNFRTRIDRASQRLRAAMRVSLHRRDAACQRLDRRLTQWPIAVVLRDRDCRQMGWRLTRLVTDRVTRLRARHDGLRRRLERRDVRQVTATLAARLARAHGRLGELARLRRLKAESRLREQAARLDALSPLAVLGRGYAVCWDEAHASIIRSAAAVRPGDRVHVALAQGELTCRVDETKSVDPHA